MDLSRTVSDMDGDFSRKSQKLGTLELGTGAGIKD